MNNFLPLGDNVKRLGRTYYIGDKLMCGFSGSGIEFLFTGTCVKVGIMGDNSATNPEKYVDRARVALFIDGERFSDLLVDSREFFLEATGLENSQHVARVYKLSECAMSTMAITNIETDGDSIKATDSKPLFIEFIGDSITCGYGVDDENKVRHFLTYTEDVTKAYAYRTAEKLNADSAFVSLSGHGIISGYTDNPDKPLLTELLPPYYEKCGYSYTDFSFDNGDMLRRPQELDWDFDTYRPDVCVINLGTNDDSYCQDFKERQLKYKDEYKNFLAVVRKRNPEARILCTLGLMGERLCDYLEMAVNEFREENNDENVFYLRLKDQLPEDGWVADFHPTRVSHEKAAIVVSEKIKEILDLA